MNENMTVCINEAKLIKAAEEGMDAFLSVFVDAIREYIGGELNAVTMQRLNAEQITLLAFDTVHKEVMDGGFIQLIYNGYGAFIFDNPFAKAMRLWGAKDFSKLIYKAKKIYDEKKHELPTDCTDEEFMALFETFPEFEDVDDEFVETEEETVSIIAQYVDENIEKFAVIEKTNE